jgi:hypothetical protein
VAHAIQEQVYATARIEGVRLTTDQVQGIVDGATREIRQAVVQRGEMI